MSKHKKKTARCRNCSKWITHLSGNARYCDSKCRLIYRTSRIIAKPQAIYDGRPVRDCASCQMPFNPVNDLHKYCGPVCKSDAKMTAERSRLGTKTPRVLRLSEMRSVGDCRDARIRRNETTMRRALAAKDDDK